MASFQPMTLRCTTRHLADMSVGQVFGEAYAKGPVCPAPDWLLEVVTDQPRWISLAMPAGSSLPDAQIFAHRMTILYSGKLQGYAVRLSDDSLRAFRLWLFRLEAMDADAKRLWSLNDAKGRAH